MDDLVVDGGLSDDLVLPGKVRYAGKGVPSVRLMYGEVPVDGRVLMDGC